jgi:hypothetical protein
MITEQGTFGHFGSAYYLPGLGINLVSQHQLINNGFNIHYDNIQHIYRIQRNDVPDIIFRRNRDGLYVTNKNHTPISSTRVAYALEEITSTIQQRLSKREQKIQDLAISLHERCGHCGDDRIVRLLNSGKLLQCPITAKQYMQARNRIGPCLHCVRGKLTQDHTNAITIDQHYPTSDNEDNIFSDIFYVKGATIKVPYLISITAKTKHIHITALKSKTGTNIYQALATLIKK